MTLADLHNPNKVEQLFHLKRQVWICKSEDQGWQEYPGSVELWQKVEDGRLLRVQRWLKRSVIVYFENDPRLEKES